MNSKSLAPALLLSVAIIAAAVLPRLDTARAAPATQPAAPAILADSPEAAGRYLVRVAGCNDCHTPEFDRRGEAVPESRWLIGTALGYKGPWGTSYAPNLRTKVQQMSEDAWVAALKTTNGRPPMPWNSLHAMSDADLHGLYRYIHTLGPNDNKTFAPLPPGERPKTPYVVFEPIMPN